MRKNFFVDLKLPVSLTQGDKPRFIARVHHADVVGKLALRLAIYAGGRDEVFPRTIELTQDGIDDVSFEPFEVPEGDSVRLTLTGTVGTLTDELIAEVPIRPWGVRVAASESGTSAESMTIFVGLPAGRTYESPEMLLVLSPTLERMVIELALGQDAYLLGSAARDPRPTNLVASSAPRGIWPPSNTTADHAADLLAATAALQYVKTAHATAAPEAARLTQRIPGLGVFIDRRAKPRRGLAVDQRRSPPPLVGQAANRRQRSPRLGGGRLGAGVHRASGARDRHQGARSRSGLPRPGILQGQR